jgi:hypothetical protein
MLLAHRRTEVRPGSTGQLPGYSYAVLDNDRDVAAATTDRPAAHTGGQRTSSGRQRELQS